MSDDRIAKLMDRADETLRTSLHARATLTFPTALYDRCSSLVALLLKLQDATTRLHDITERAPELWPDLGN